MGGVLAGTALGIIFIPVLYVSVMRLAAGRNRLLVLHGRRSPGDKEWIVTMVNPTLLKIDPPHPLAQEWASGRDYLVFARTEHEARDRAMRRFSTRPGAAIRSVAPAAHDLFHG